MSVNPGFSGQAFLPQTYEKIRAARALLAEAGAAATLIQVDGGVCPENAAGLVEAGADVLVSGSAFFGHKPYDARLAAFAQTVEGRPPRPRTARRPTVAARRVSGQIVLKRQLFQSRRPATAYCPRAVGAHDASRSLTLTASQG